MGKLHMLSLKVQITIQIIMKVLVFALNLVLEMMLIRKRHWIVIRKVQKRVLPTANGSYQESRRVVFGLLQKKIEGDILISSKQNIIIIVVAEEILVMVDSLLVCRMAECLVILAVALQVVVHILLVPVVAVLGIVQDAVEVVNTGLTLVCILVLAVEH